MNTDCDDTAVDTLILKACQLQRKACHEMNIELLEKLQQFILRLTYLKNLLEIFRQTPRGKVHGKNGVAVKAHLSRGGVYFRLKWLGLTADDLSHRDATLESLVVKSNTLKPLVDLIKSLSEETQ